MASAAPGDKTGFCKTTEHYAYHRNSTGQWVRCLPHRGSNGRIVWDWTDVAPPTVQPTPPTAPPAVTTPPMAPPAVATTKRPHFTG